MHLHQNAKIVIDQFLADLQPQIVKIDMTIWGDVRLYTKIATPTDDSVEGWTIRQNSDVLVISGMSLESPTYRFSDLQEILRLEDALC